MSNIPNIGKFPAPGLHWGKALITKNTKAISKKNAEVKGFIESQLVYGNTPSGSLLKSASQNIILDSDILNVFFEKLAEFSISKTKPVKANISNPSSNAVPETRQFIDYSSAGGVQKTVVQNPINRSANNVGHPQPMFPDKTI